MSATLPFPLLAPLVALHVCLSFQSSRMYGTCAVSLLPLPFQINEEMRSDSIERKDDCEDISIGRFINQLQLKKPSNPNNGVFHINDQTYTSKTDGDKVMATFGGPFRHNFRLSLVYLPEIMEHIGMSQKKRPPMAYSWFPKVHQKKIP